MASFVRLAPVCLAILLGGATPNGQTAAPGQAEPSVTFRLPAGIDTAGLDIQYFLDGSHLFVDTRRLRDYTVSTSIQGRPAKSFKAHAYLPGFGFNLVSIDLSQGPRSWIIELVFRPLGTVHLRGRVTAPDGQSLDSLSLGVMYVADFNCQWLQLIDCGNGFQRITSATLSRDSTFVVDLPDFAHDPALSGFSGKGHWVFTANDARGEPVYWLDAPGFGAVVERYPEVVTFVAQRR